MGKRKSLKSSSPVLPSSPENEANGEPQESSKEEEDQPNGNSSSSPSEDSESGSEPSSGDSDSDESSGPSEVPSSFLSSPLLCVSWILFYGRPLWKPLMTHLHAVSYPPLSKNPYHPGCNNHIFRKNQLHPQNTMPIF